MFNMSATKNRDVYLRVVSSDEGAMDLTRRTVHWWNSSPGLAAGRNWVVLNENDQGAFSECTGLTVKVITGGLEELLYAYQESVPGQVFIILDGMAASGAFAGVKLPDNVFLDRIELEQHKATLQAVVAALERNLEYIPEPRIHDETVYTGHGLRILVVEDRARGRALSSGLWMDSEFDPKKLIGCYAGRRGHNLTIVRSLSEFMEIMSTTNEYKYDLILAPSAMISDGWEFIRGDGKSPVNPSFAVSQLGKVLPFGGIIEREGISRGIPVGLITYQEQNDLNRVWSYPGSMVQTDIDGCKAFVYHYEQPEHLKFGTDWSLFLSSMLTRGPVELRAKAGFGTPPEP
jgi:hypothetical protein